MPERSYRLVMKKGPNYGTNPTDVYPAYVSGMEPVGNIASEGVKYRAGYNGMEKDDEVKGSGNSYDFGARIYDPRIGRWLGCDPQTEKYQGLSPYCFVGNGPLNAIDPDGEKIVVVEQRGFLGIGRKTVEYIPGTAYTGKNEYVKETWTALNALAILDEETLMDAVNVKQTVKIHKISLRQAIIEGGNYEKTITGHNIGFGPRYGALFTRKDGTKGVYSPYRLLGHELRHFLNFINNTKQYDQETNPDLPSNIAIAPTWKNQQEKSTIEQQNEISKAVGDIIRDSHEGDFLQTTGPTSKEQDPNVDNALKQDLSNTIDKKATSSSTTEGKKDEK